MKPLSETVSEGMRAVSACIQSLHVSTSGFNDVKAENFELVDNRRVLLAGKGIDFIGTPAECYDLWQKMDRDFVHATAASALVTPIAKATAAAILASVFKDTDRLKELGVDWVMAHPYAFPVYVNATAICAKKKFKSNLKLGGASDRKIGRKDAERIVEFIKHKPVLPEGEILAGMGALLEGIVRDKIGKVVSEDFVRLALEKAGLQFARDIGGTQVIRGLYCATRTDFALPCNAEPKAFIDVRKSAVNHSSHYASDLSNSVADRISAHPDCLAILVYDGDWSGPALERVARGYDHAFHILKSTDAVALVQKHLAGKDQRKVDRVYYGNKPPREVEAMSDALAQLIACVEANGGEIGRDLAASLETARKHVTPRV